jgi:type VI secretion system protein
MKSRRLLDRIRYVAENPTRRISENPRNVVFSIREHLQRVLNTRRGDAPIAEDFGIPDFTDFMLEYPDSVREFERAIRTTIQKFEPRLKGVRVNFVPQEEDVLSVSFQIIAQLIVEEEKDPVVFESVLDADGKIRIKR